MITIIYVILILRRFKEPFLWPEFIKWTRVNIDLAIPCANPFDEARLHYLDPVNHLHKYLYPQRVRLSYQILKLTSGFV